MLTPRKHLNLDVSVLRISALMLREIKRKGVVEFDKLRAYIVRRVGPDGELAFMPALDLLYLLGKTDFHLKNDTIEYKAE